MRYAIEIRPKAERDLKTIPRSDALRITTKIMALSHGLTGDIKKLTNFTPEYRLRVGDWRILFEIEGDKIVIYRIMNRREAYR
ncbi:MAG TPA: type II toxin-antitoxin system RelE/ParE family toxin [Opitutaceae bacterium]|jgi:mRNA interferase RelE/StbE|nr:type II toxin-antitoxin system RelE/ParE family toxin [Opitutaceae bacterium]